MTDTFTDRPGVKDREQDKFRPDSNNDTVVGTLPDLSALPNPYPITFAQLDLTPNVVNLSTPLANAEYNVAITDDTKILLIRSRDKLARLQFTFTSGESGTKYFTIRPSTAITIDELQLSGMTLYIQSSKAGNTVEILELHT